MVIDGAAAGTGRRDLFRFFREKGQVDCHCVKLVFGQQAAVGVGVIFHRNVCLHNCELLNTSNYIYADMEVLYQVLTVLQSVSIHFSQTLTRQS